MSTTIHDYCDANCDRQSSWLPNLQTVPGLVFPGQGIGAYPVITPATEGSISVSGWTSY